MKFKKLKKALALALALTVAGTTNLGGLENVVNIHAGTTYYKTFTESINGVDWEVYCELSAGSGPTKYTNITTTITNKDALANKVIEVPEKVGECTVTKISADCFRNTDISGVILNEDIKIIEERAFMECSKLKSVEYKGINLPAGCFSQCTSLEEVKLSGSGVVTIGQSAFYGNTSLKKLEIADTVSDLIVEDLAFYGDTLLSNVSTLPNITLGNGSFAYCGSLKELTFNGVVKYKRTDLKHTDYGAFLGAFEQSDEEKNITFNGDADIPEDCFDSCTGLTKVTINGTATLGNTAFYNCKSLDTVQFGTGKITLGNSVFSKCDALKELEFQADVDMISNSQTERMYAGKLSEYNLTGSVPFYNSSIEKIRFNSGTVNIRINSSSIKELYFNAEKLYGGIDSSCTSVDTVVFENSKQLGGVESYTYYTNSYYTFLNKCTHQCTVVGYSSIDLDNKIVENWIDELDEDVKGKITFKNIILGDSLNVTYDGKIISDNPTIEDFDANKVTVSVGYYDFVNKEYKDVQVAPSTDGTDVTGYLITVPSSLHTGTNRFSVTLSGCTKYPVVEVVNKAPESIRIDWKEDAIKELVSNQSITAADVISGASVTYNDGDIKTVTADELTLNKTVTVAGDNTFVVTLNDTDVTAEKTFTLKENYITAIKAKYNSNDTLYVGDKIDASKVKLTPTYKYNEDKTVNRDISFTKISQSQLTKEGANEITVYYNDLETTMVVSAAAVVPTKIYAMFDTNCKYYEGQENIDPQTVLVTVEYNNGTKKSGADLAYAYEVTKIQDGATIIQAKVSYAELESVIEIPVTPKEITGIKASANIASATEGTTLPKTMIDKIEITYNNGKTETLDASTIDYNNLTFNHYTIIANAPNTITINYAGKTAEITIWGVSNSVTRIYAEYIGSGQIVGTQIPTSDIAVHAVNANGQITTITDGILLENAVPYNVGPNTVTVHYGSFSCTIIVTGLLIPTTTVVPSLTPGATGTSATQEPTKTNQPTATSSVTETPGTATTVISTPNTANSAPIVANSSVTITSNNKKITAATDETYKVYTNKNVVLTIASVSASAIKYQVVAKDAKVSDTAWKDVVNNKITVSKTKKASIVYIQYTDANGAVQTIHTNGFTIDKKKATVNVKKNKTYKSGKKVTFKDASGIKSAKLDGKKVKSGVKVKKKGTHTLVVTDKAGNKTTIKFKIK